MACNSCWKGSHPQGPTTLCIKQFPAAPQCPAVGLPRLTYILVLEQTLGDQTDASGTHISHHRLIARRSGTGLEGTTKDGCLRGSTHSSFSRTDLPPGA